MLNPRMNRPISWESTIPEKLPAVLKNQWETRSADFRMRRDELVTMVRQGEMTLKAARLRAAELADDLKKSVDEAANREKARPSPLSVKLAEADKTRQNPPPPERTQQRTVELLAHNLTELRIANRKDEFEARAYVKTAANATPAPSLDKLFAFLDESVQAEDAAAMEWCRRQLQRLRDYAVDESTRERIDIACDRPGVLNRRLVAKYQETLGPRLAEKGLVEVFLDKAVQVDDANAAAAVFEIARREPEAMRPEALEKIAASVNRLPDQAFSYARHVDREVRHEEVERIERFAETCHAWVDQAAALADVKQPTESELSRAQRASSLPPLAIDEPIGLVVEGRAYEKFSPAQAEDRPAPGSPTR